MPVGNALFAAFLELVDAVLAFYVWAVILGALLSWLTAFGVVNSYNRFVQVFSDFLIRITEPVLAPIRRVIPSAGGIDLSPLVLIFAISFLRSFIHHLVF